MKRNMMEVVSKVIGQNVIPVGYDLDLDEISALMRMAIMEGKASEAIEIAFDYGFVLGSRAARSGRIRKL